MRSCRENGDLVSDDAFIYPSGALCIEVLTIVSQAIMNIAACLGAVAGPLVIGAFTKTDEVNGWKKFYVSLPYSYL